MTGDEIREVFLRFFESKEHLRIPSSSLIPAEDPTLLLTNAGMVQFKPYFTGEMPPPGPRMTSAQKCFRSTDIDEVGDSTHLTFFEMLGNFSVGDYFKKEAIAYAWEFVTEYLELDRERLWATVFLEDDEAFGYWTATGIPADRIRRFGEADNFWGPAGNEGPCGPCSEINYDFGSERGCHLPDCGPNCGNIVEVTGQKCDRFVELWNLVFMQFYQALDGSRIPLPAPNIDTGMGLERAAVILQGKRNIYGTDIFQALVQKVAKLCGKEYGKNLDIDYAIRVVTEHARSAAFLIADGVVPGNDGRDYVLRRVIRRAIRYGKKLGLDSPFLTEVGTAVIARMKGQHADLEERREFILRVIGLEEERFADATRKGTDFVESYISGAKLISRQDLDELKRVLAPALLDKLPTSLGEFADQAGSVISRLRERVNELAKESPIGFTEKEDGYYRAFIMIYQSLESLYQNSRHGEAAFLSPGEGIEQAAQSEIRIDGIKESFAQLENSVIRIPGTVAFVLYDTYGFPVELTKEIAREYGLEVDMEGFEREMEAQRTQSRSEGKSFDGNFDAVRTYQDLSVGSTHFLGYEALSVPTVVVGLLKESRPVNQAMQNENVEVILKETPFYAEMGGQMGDAGEIVGQGGTLHVDDTQTPIAGLTVHMCTVVSGSICLGDTVEATVDSTRRQDTARNHTATHMLHAALRQVLGSHVRQHGSLVTPDRLRFDFTHVSPLTEDELRDVQRLTNEKIRDNITVSSRETTYRQAVAQGALAFFGDRYGDQVRVVEVANGVPFSVEVCGGTHVQRTGDIGYCHIVSESSIGSGLRRVEAVSGRAAEGMLSQHSTTMREIVHRLQVPPDELLTRVVGLLAEMEQATKQSETLERELLKHQVAELPRTQVAGVNVVSGELKVSNAELLREAGDWLKNDIKSGIIVLGMVLESRPSMMIMATNDNVEQGFHAGNAVKEAAKAMDGGGGGRPEMAQAGGREPGKLQDALRAAEEEVRRWKEKA